MKHPIFLFTAAIPILLLLGAAGGFLASQKLGPIGLSPGQGVPEHDSHTESSDDSEHDRGGHEEDIVRLSDEEIAEFGIEVAKADRGKLRIEVTLPGEIVPNADELAHIVPRISGIAGEVNKRLGDSVTQGEVLAVIESRELADAKAAYLAGLERLKLTRSKYEREEKLWQRKVSSEQDYLDAKQGFAEMQVQLRTAEQKLYALGFNEEYLKKLPDLPDESFTRYEIVAPFDGTIIKKHITLGELITTETEIYEIADLSSVWVNLTVYQKDLALVTKGQSAKIVADKIGLAATGIIDYVSPIVEESTRTATARVVLENRDGLWRPGLFITGSVNIARMEAPVVLPRSALQTIDGQYVIFVRDPEGFRPTPVELGRADESQVEVVSGLDPGQQVALTNTFMIKSELGKESFGGHIH